jgi:hypothetical protein
MRAVSGIIKFFYVTVKDPISSYCLIKTVMHFYLVLPGTVKTVFLSLDDLSHCDKGNIYSSVSLLFMLLSPLFLFSYLNHNPDNGGRKHL